MSNTDKKIFAVILDYDDFRNMSEERRLKMLEHKDVEWRVYIPREKVDFLTPKEREQLKGFKITHIEPIKIRTYTAKELFTMPKETPVLIDNEFKSKHDKRAERQRLKRSIPLKIGVINTKKKGGR